MTRVTKEQEALLDELLKGCEDPQDVLGEHGLLQALQKRLIERALEGELTEHVGYETHAPSGHGSGNSRNGKTKKTIRTANDQFEIEVRGIVMGVLPRSWSKSDSAVCRGLMRK